MLINTEFVSSIKEIIIIETKEYATYRLEKQNQDLKKIYSDYNLILLKIDFHIETIRAKESKQ